MSAIKTVHTKILHRAGETDIVDTFYDKYVIENYNFTIDYHQIDPEKITLFINELKESFDLKINKLLQYTDLFIYVTGKNFFIDIVKQSKKTPISIYAKDLDTLEKIFNIFKKYEYKNTPELKIKLTEYIQTIRGIQGNTKIFENEDFKHINELYYPFLDLDMFMNEFIFGDENILILCGEPGTGKSKFASVILKKLLQNQEYFKYLNDKKEDTTSDASDLKSIEDFDDLEDFLDSIERTDSFSDNYYYVSTTKNVNIVTSDEFWDRIQRSNLVILDDLDYLLSSRNENREDVQKNQFISNLLTFSDGIQKNRTKIIITTNQSFDTIDNALLRKGRLFAILEFRPLTYNEALKIWKSENLPEKEFKKLFKNIDSIKHSDLGHEIQKIKRNKKLIRKKDFILDESVDALRRAQPRRAGLV